ncbi:hypothetical protein HYU19_04550 [Candidatus Woesearchaeota archaeon]|nr:hypothetical protein [Candidatus Woesearchaeota archaeon]
MAIGTYKELIALCMTCKTSFHAHESNMEKWKFCDVCREPFVVIGLKATATINREHYDKEN